MSPRAAAAAVARTASTVHVPTRTRVAPRPAPARRRSGEVARPRTRARASGLALPRYDFVSVLDRLLRGPAYIAIVGVLLVGIVFFNVDVLELNHGIASTDARAAQLKRQNAALTLQIATLGSSERIQRVALQRGLVLPQPGDVRYLRVTPTDAAHALRVMTAPDPTGAGAAPPAVVSQQSTPVSGVSATPTPVAAAPAPTAPATTTTPATTTPTTTSTSTPATQAPTPAAATPAGAAAAPPTP